MAGADREERSTRSAEEERLQIEEHRKRDNYFRKAIGEIHREEVIGPKLITKAEELRKADPSSRSINLTPATASATASAQMEGGQAQHRKRIYCGLGRHGLSSI